MRGISFVGYKLHPAKHNSHLLILMRTKRMEYETSNYARQRN